ncbi:MAG: hypothetical protein AcusKO_49500 [Acuticoccus sp.]
MPSPAGGRNDCSPPAARPRPPAEPVASEPAIGALAPPASAVQRAMRILRLLRQATGVGASLLDLGAAGGPLVLAADEAERLRFAAAWRTPDQPGTAVLKDPDTGDPVAIAVTSPICLGGQNGHVALIEPDTTTLLPRHAALLELLAELSGEWAAAHAVSAATQGHLRTRNAFLESVSALSGLGTLQGSLPDERIEASPRALAIFGAGAIRSVDDLLACVAAPDRDALDRLLRGAPSEAAQTLTLALASGGAEDASAHLRIAHHGGDAAPRGFVVVVEDTTHQTRRFAELTSLAEHDPVTGLFNRNTLARTLARAHAEAQQGDTIVGTLLISVGDLRRINELHGDTAGDAVLRIIAETLKGSRRPGDAVLRVGSGEFAVVVAGAGDEDALTRRVEAIRSALDGTIAIGARRIEVTTHYGLAVFPADTAGGIDIFAAATYALNDAMRGPSGTTRRYRPAYRDQCERERNLIEDVRAALARNEFTPFFQPKVDLETGTIVGFEALCRWCHPTRGVLTPGAFYKALTSPRVSGELSDVALVGSFCAAHMWRRRGLTFGNISINLNATQLARANLVDSIEALQVRYHVPAANIAFEVLENVLIGDDAVVQANLRALAERGFTIALDDFGTGFASLSQVRESYIGEVKIDRSFVTHAGSNLRDQQIVSAIVLMARRLGLKAVAEGIEDEETLRKLRAMGCATGQGFVFAKALPLSEATEFLSRQGRIHELLGGAPPL